MAEVVKEAVARVTVAEVMAGVVVGWMEAEWAAKGVVALAAAEEVG